MREIDSEYNKTKEWITNYKQSLIKRGIHVPTVHVLPKVTEEMLLKDLEWRYKDERLWGNVLDKWKEAHLEPARARLSLLRQKEYDQTGHFSKAFSNGKHEIEEMKKWEKAILHGLSVDQLEEFEHAKREESENCVNSWLKGADWRKTKLIERRWRELCEFNISGGGGKHGCG